MDRASSFINDYTENKNDDDKGTKRLIFIIFLILLIIQREIYYVISFFIKGWLVKVFCHVLLLIAGILFTGGFLVIMYITYSRYIKRKNELYDIVIDEFDRNSDSEKEENKEVTPLSEKIKEKIKIISGSNLPIKKKLKRSVSLDQIYLQDTLMRK